MATDATANNPQRPLRKSKPSGSPMKHLKWFICIYPSSHSPSPFLPLRGNGDPIPISLKTCWSGSNFCFYCFVISASSELRDRYDYYFCLIKCDCAITGFTFDAIGQLIIIWFICFFLQSLFERGRKGEGGGGGVGWKRRENICEPKTERKRHCFVWLCCSGQLTGFSPHSVGNSTLLTRAAAILLNCLLYSN